MWIENKDEIVEAGNHFIEHILNGHGITPGKHNKYLCISPDHNDNEPSMVMYNDHLYCFGCGKSYDSLETVKVLDGLDTKEALKKLADIAGVEVKYKNDKEMLNMYKELSDILIHDYNKFPKEVKEYVAKKKLDYRKFDDFDVGVFNPKQFRSVISRYDAHKVHKLNQTMLNKPTSLIFTIKDIKGRPVAFAARDCTGAKPKYINTSTTIYYKKSRNPFLIDRVLDYKYVYVVEGYTDALLMQIKGIPAVAIASATVPEKTVETLKDLGVEGIIVVLDGDAEGIKGVNRTIAKVLPESGMKCAMKRLPNGIDPDEYINDKGVSGFNQLPMMPFSEFWMRENKELKPRERLNEILKIMSKAELGNPSNHFNALEKVCNEMDINYNVEDIKKMYRSKVVLEKLPGIMDSMHKAESEIRYLRRTLGDMLERIDD